MQSVLFVIWNLIHTFGKFNSRKWMFLLIFLDIYTFRQTFANLHNVELDLHKSLHSAILNRNIKSSHSVRFRCGQKDIYSTDGLENLTTDSCSSGQNSFCENHQLPIPLHAVSDSLHITSCKFVTTCTQS